MRDGPSPRARAYVRFVLRWGALLWAIAIVLALPAAWRTAGLYAKLRSDLEELLPRESKSVVAIDELRQRVSGLQYLGVVVDVGDAANMPAAERMLDDLAARVREYPPELVRAVRVGDSEERAFLEKHSGLYLEVEDLQTILARITARRDWEVRRADGSDLDDDETPPPLDFKDIEDRYRARTRSQGKMERGRFSSTELRTTLMLVEVGAFTTGQKNGAELFRRVKADLAALGGPDAYAPGMRVGYSGDIAISVEETSALLADLSISSVLVIVLVLGSVVYFFRWPRSLLAILPPLFVATFFAFGLASLPPFRVTELNSNTAFLGSIVVGNGINVGIMLIARYLEERRKGLGVEGALEIAVWAARPGTFSAALAASASYASLALTEFRGFRQFGTIGGLGMVLAWVCAYLLLPPLVRWLNRGGPVPARPASRGGFTAVVARLVKARPAALVGLAAAFTVGALYTFTRVDDSRLEHDFSKLRRRDTWQTGEGYWGRRMDAVLGTYLTPAAILTDGPEQARRAAAAVRKARDEGALGELVASVRTIDDVLPSRQPEKLAVIEGIREAMTPKMRSLVQEDRRELVERLLDEGSDQPVTAADLPRTFTAGLREKTGELDRVVLVYPKPSKALWEGEALAAFVARLREAAAEGAGPGERAPRLASSLALSSDILESVRRDGPRASAAALAGVVMVVFLLFRFSSATFRVVASLLVGVSWLFALSYALGVKINFANFIAFPITFGIGVEYAVNVMSRYVEGGSKDTEGAIRATGGAVALCSTTTIIGYSSLLVAENQALFLFGLLAVLGEITCLLAAVVALPAVLE